MRKCVKLTSDGRVRMGSTRVTSDGQGRIGGTRVTNDGCVKSKGVKVTLVGERDAANQDLVCVQVRYRKLHFTVLCSEGESTRIRIRRLGDDLLVFLSDPRNDRTLRSQH